MTSVLVVAPLAVVLADDTLRKWFGASLAVRARPSRSPKAAPTVAVSQPAESPTLANSKTHSHGHPRWYSIGYKRSLRFFSKSTPTEHLPHLDLRAPYFHSYERDLKTRTGVRWALFHVKHAGKCVRAVAHAHVHHYGGASLPRSCRWK